MDITPWKYDNSSEQCHTQHTFLHSHSTPQDTLAVLQREDLLAAELDNEGHALWGTQARMPTCCTPPQRHHHVAGACTAA